MKSPNPDTLNSGSAPMGPLGPGHQARNNAMPMGGGSLSQHGGSSGPAGQGMAGSGVVGAPPAGNIMNSDLQIDDKMMMAGGADVLGEAGGHQLGAE